MEFITRNELMELLKISRSTVIRMEKKGVLKPVVLKGTDKKIYDMEDIKQLIQESKQQNG